MATKTITIREAAYSLLAENKLEEESFSEEITRLLSEKKKKSLLDFFGIITEEEGEGMLRDLEVKKALNIKLLKKRLQEFQ